MEPYRPRPLPYPTQSNVMTRSPRGLASRPAAPRPAPAPPGGGMSGLPRKINDLRVEPRAATRSPVPPVYRGQPTHSARGAPPIGSMAPTRATQPMGVRRPPMQGAPRPPQPMQPTQMQGAQMQVPRMPQQRVSMPREGVQVPQSHVMQPQALVRAPGQNVAGQMPVRKTGGLMPSTGAITGARY